MQSSGPNHWPALGSNDMWSMQPLNQVLCNLLKTLQSYPTLPSHILENRIQVSSNANPYLSFFLQDCTGGVQPAPPCHLPVPSSRPTCSSTSTSIWLPSGQTTLKQRRNNLRFRRWNNVENWLNLKVETTVRFRRWNNVEKRRDFDHFYVCFPAINCCPNDELLS